MSYELYAKGIAQICDSDPSIVLEILRLSEEYKNIYHGIKQRISLPDVIERGIEPRTPTGEYVSFWTSGLRLFINRDDLPITPVHTMDTSFFHYGHTSYEPESCHMQLAISDVKTLERNGINVGWHNNSQITIPHAISPDYFSLLNLILEHPKINDSDYLEARKYGMLAERILMEILLEYLKDYSVGRRISRNIRI